MNRREAILGLSTLPFVKAHKYGSEKKILVLVHGAWHGGWCWKRVTPFLFNWDFIIYTPTLTGLGERRHLHTPAIGLTTHIHDVVSALEHEDLNNVTLVGHSYAGMVITGVADVARARIAHVIYLDAFLPDDGKALINYVTIPFEEIAKANGDGWQIPVPPQIVSTLGIPKEDVDWVTKRLSHQPLKTFTEPLQLSAPLNTGLRKTYVRLTEDRAHFNEAASRAKRSGLNYFEFFRGGHDAMISTPEELAQLIKQIA
jgi:pimeloyl-ACP methyl ester carboxylesterase